MVISFILDVGILVLFRSGVVDPIGDSVTVVCVIYVVGNVVVGS